MKTHILDTDDKALESARLREENQRLSRLLETRDAELAVIQRVQEGLVSKLDMQAIYDLVGDKIREIFHNTDVEIRIYDPRTNLMHFPYFIDNGKRITVDPIPLTDSGISSYILRTGQTLVLNENLWQEAAKFGSTPILSEEGHLAKSGVFVPLVVNHQASGLLVLGDVKREHAFSESDVRLLQTLANSMSTALENALLFDETQHLFKEMEQRAAELAIINSVQEGLASKLDVQAIYDLVGDKIRDIFRAQGTAIYLFDYKTETLDTPYCYLKTRFEIESRPFSEHPIAKLMVNTLQPITYRTLEEYRALGGGILENSEEYKSGMYVPLLVGKELKGMVGIANLDKENAYNDSDLRLLQTLANSMSVALENARLFNETQRLLKETEQRNAELAVINSIQQGLAAELDFQALVDLVGDKLRQVFGNSDVTIGIYDPKTDFGSVPYIVENGQRLHIEPFKIVGRGFTGEMIGNPRTILINQNMAQEVEKFGSRVLPGTTLAKSMLDVPLVVGGVLRGKLQLQDMHKEHAFTDSDVRLLETIASSMSVALENARLFDETQRLLKETEERNAELTLINSVQSALAAKHNIQGIYDAVGDRLREIFDRADVGITIYDEKTNLIHIPYDYESGQRVMVDAFALREQGFLAHVLRTLEPLFINENMAQEMEKYGSPGVIAGTMMDKSLVHVPLIVGDRARGMISIKDSQHEHAFSNSDVRLLTTIANSMSVALENARLFDETQRLLKETEESNAELAIITSVQQALASKLEMQAIYDLVGDKVRDVFDAQGVGISYYDRPANFIRFPYCLFRGKRITEKDFELGKGLTSHVIQSGQPVLINENAAERYKELGAIFAATESEDTAKSWLGVPLIAGDQVTGVIQLENYEREFAYSDSDVRLLMTLANSMSVALENARLFDEVQKQNAEITEALERETASNDILRVIAESPTDIRPVLEVIARNAAQLSGSDDAIITLRAGDILYVDAHYGAIPTFPAGEGIRFNRDSVAGRAILDGRPLQAIHNPPGVRSEYPEGDKIARKYGYCMSCAVPLLREGKAIGAISIRRLKPELLTEKQIALVQSFANQAAIAVENVRLFDETTRLLKETEQRAAELQIINSVQDGLASKLEIQAIYDLVGDKISEIFKSPAVFISTYDLVTNRAYYPYYSVERKRIPLEPRLPSGAALEVMRTRQPVFLQHDAEKRLIEEYQMATIPGTPDAESYLLVPMIVGSIVKGGIGVMSTDRQRPLDESSVRLLQTIASSMSVALENARLFDETQRLLKETEQRAAELAIINSVQAGLASQLEMQAIYDLVGDRIRDLLNAQSVWIITFDPATRTRRVRYSFENGQRYYTSELLPYNKLTEHLIATKKPLVINRNFRKAIARFEMVNIAGTQDQVKSIVYIPIMAGEDVKGFISLPNIERENAFSESEVNLLSTFASSMSIALENIRLFDETRRLLKETEQANQAKSAFLSSMSHELRTPLNAIINFVEMVARGMIGPVNQEQVELLDQALHSSKHLLNLINDVLDISKIQAGQLTLFIEDQVSVQVEVEAALNIVGGLLQEKGLQLIRDIDPHLPMISCDRRRLRQVLLNLISNAIKFTQTGTVTVSVKNQGQAMLFAVIDTGPGIPLNKQGLIFEPFIQAENGERQVQGTGLGLPISRSLVRAHGGELWVDSERGEGAAFFFTLPVERRSML